MCTTKAKPLSHFPEDKQPLSPAKSWFLKNTSSKQSIYWNLNNLIKYPKLQILSPWPLGKCFKYFCLLLKAVLEGVFQFNINKIFLKTKEDTTQSNAIRILLQMKEDSFLTSQIIHIFIQVFLLLLFSFFPYGVFLSS